MFDKAPSYAMVVIDEAQAYRNPDALRAGVLRKLLEGSPPKDLVLLTATPVNNSPVGPLLPAQLLHPQRRRLRPRGHPLAQGALRRGDGARPGRPLARQALRHPRRGRGAAHAPLREALLPERDRAHRGEEVPITFPTPKVHRVAYDLEAVLPGFFERFAHALDCGDGDCEHEPEVAAAAPC